MPKPQPIDQLRILNELLARSEASNPEMAEHARRALNFLCDDQGIEALGISLKDTAAKLAQLHFGESVDVAISFAHWHVPATENASPLWIRQAIVTEMKRLAGSRNALLLVTGLREAICPEGSYWTKSREREYRRVREWIDDLACAWATRGSQLQVIVL